MNKLHAHFHHKGTSLFLIIFLLSLAVKGYGQEGDPVVGEKLFKANCGACHYPWKNMTGPKLQGSRQRWIENSTEANFYAWVKNSQAVIKAGDSYANRLFKEWGKTIMPAQAVTNEQIDHIFAYVEIAKPPVSSTGNAVAANESQVAEETSPLIWWVVIVLLLVIIGSLLMTKGNLSRLERAQEGETKEVDETYFQAFKRWAWENRKGVGVFGLLTALVLLTIGMMGLSQIGVFEDYKPEQPIAYSHKLHAGQLQIDCKYCHTAVTKSKHASIPSVNVCMNCHKEVNEGTESGTQEIAKIYAAAGWDPDIRSYSGKTQPIEWVKVHNLPDHVYFNHSQHVKVGGIDCAQCHGNMKKETVGRVMTTADLNAVEENKIKFSKPTLTMGWCIECHEKSAVDVAGSHIEATAERQDTYYGVIHQRLLNDRATYQKYLEDDAISVAELGGWECAKCHY